MVWFKVDDKLHSHPKTSNASLAAMGLWSVAGSWCADHLTDGRVPAHMIQSLSRGAVELADELVAAGLWVRVKDGYRFHQWHTDSDGTKRNPTRKEVEEERRKKAEAGRKGGLASGKTRSKREANASARASRLVEPPTRPSPSKEGSGGARPLSQGAARSPKPPDHPPTEVGEVRNPDWRNGKAFGIEPDPAQAARARQGAAVARAAVPKRSRLDDRGPSALARLAEAVADLPPLVEPATDPPEEPLAQVVQLHPPVAEEP